MACLETLRTRPSYEATFSSILTKIGDELQLNSDEQTLIESRMFSKEEVKVLCPHGVRSFHKVRNIENYINDVLNSYNDKVLSIANDEVIGCHNANDTNRYRAIFHSRKPINTRGLS